MVKLRILLADSHPDVRTQLAARLTRENDFEIVGQAANSTQALNYALANKPDVLLIDPMMRDGFGLVNLCQIISRLPQIAVVVLTTYVDTSMRMKFVKMGVSQILSKGLASEKLVEILREAGGSALHSSD